MAPSHTVYVYAASSESFHYFTHLSPFQKWIANVKKRGGGNDMASGSRYVEGGGE